MKLGALPTLHAVVRLGSFAAAAREVGLTPGAISQQMRNLEDYFGQPLFDRSGRSVQVTPFAREIADTVEGTIYRLQELRDRAQPSVRGRVRFAVISSVQLASLPACLLRVSQQYPGLQVVLERESTSEVLIEALKAGHLDAAIVVRPHAGLSRKLVGVELAREPFALIYPCDLPRTLAAREIMTRLPWVRYSTSLTGGKIASSYVRRVAPSLRPRYEAISLTGVLSMVSEGLGFSVIPKFSSPVWQAYPVHTVDLNIPRRSVMFVRRASDQDNRRIDGLLRCAQDVYDHASAR